MPYGNLLVENVPLSLASLSIHHVEDARRSARRARIHYLQFKTLGNSKTLQLWRLWEEEAEAEIEDMRCATGYTLKKMEKREPDWNNDAGAGGATAKVSA